jgi:hypothetical protein
MTDDDGPTYRYSFTVTEEYRRTLARALVVAGYRAPHVWMTAVVVLVLGAGASLLLASGIPAIVAAVVEAMLIAAVPLAARRRVDAAAALGSVARSGFGPTSFRIGRELPGMLVDYDRVTEIVPDDDLVRLRIRTPSSTARAVWPRALFPDAELARIRAVTARE